MDWLGSNKCAILVVVGLLLGIAFPGASTSSLNALATEPVFTAEQAAAGERLYRRKCAACHGRELEGEQLAPSLVGERFALMWAGEPASLLHSALLRMPLPPLGDPGSLSDEEYVAILAYVLQANGLGAGERALPLGEALADLEIPGRETSDRSITVASVEDAARLLKSLPAVTDTMLNAPAPEDWLSWRRTQDQQGFSPLSEIDRNNVSKLTIAWRAPLEPGNSMPSPLVHAGVMYLQTFPDVTLALDASTGEELWRYRYKPGRQSSKKGGLALRGGRVFVPTSDLHVLALDAKTGELIWDHDIQTEVPKDERFQLRAAPFVAGDKVLQGVQSFRAPRGSFLVALDAATGEEAWRFNTVARPGEVGGNTWNGLELDARNGGSIWVPGSYDADLGLVYVGPAPTYDTSPLLEPSGAAGTNSDALFTNTTVALHAATGKLAWYFQHLHNDQWDLDWSFERQVAELEINGRQRKVVVTVGKSAIVEAVDAETGAYLFSIDLGLQNVIEAIDPETGRKKISEDSRPSLTETRLICPTAVGARSWPPTSYNPHTKMLYLPLTEGCMKGGPEGFKGLFTSGVGLQLVAHPSSSDGNMGRLQAVDLATRQIKWSFRQATPLISSTLVTAGGVVFVGDLDPSLKAFDDRTGDLLWRTELEDTPGSNIISYGADGRQYVAVVVGLMNNVTRDWTGQYQRQSEARGVKVAAPPGGGAEIITFALRD